MVLNRIRMNLIDRRRFDARLRCILVQKEQTGNAFGWICVRLELIFCWCSSYGRKARNLAQTLKQANRVLSNSDTPSRALGVSPLRSLGTNQILINCNRHAILADCLLGIATTPVVKPVKASSEKLPALRGSNPADFLSPRYTFEILNCGSLLILGLLVVA